MEFQQLAYFIECANMESISEAAAALHISQPALSKSVKKLENELGFSLFDRTGRRIRLNERGRIFLQGVETSLRDLNEARQLAEKMAAGVSGKTQAGRFLTSTHCFTVRRRFYARASTNSNRFRGASHHGALTYAPRIRLHVLCR